MHSYAENNSVDDGFDALSYGYAGGAKKSGDPATHGERDLWCAVIAQAFMDIGAIASPTPRDQGEVGSARRSDFDEAVRWLLRDKSNFPYICDLAGGSPHVIRCAARIFYGRRQLALGAVHEEKKPCVTKS